jgi:hypothetical protein
MERKSRKPNMYKKADVKEVLRKELKEELRAEIKDELRVQIEAEIGAEIEQRIRAELEKKYSAKAKAESEKAQGIGIPHTTGTYTAKMKLSKEDYDVLLETFYQNVAKRLHYNVTETTKFDSMYITVSENIQNTMYKRYRTILKNDPQYTPVAIAAHLAMGPKVNHNLQDDEVEYDFLHFINEKRRPAV